MTGGTIIESSLPENLEDDPYAPDPIEDEEVVPAVDRAEQARIAVIEAEARRSGWRPLAEFRGDPGAWRPAEEFLARGQNVNPILRKQLRDTQDKLERTTGEIIGLRETVQTQSTQIQQLLDNSKRAEQVGYDRALRELKLQQRDAAATQDLEGFDKISEQITALEEERAAVAVPPKPAAAPAPAPQPQPQALAPEVQEFIADNPWFLNDRVLHAAMQAEHAAISEKSPALPLSENFQRAKENVMRRFPEKFGLPPAPRRPGKTSVTPSNGAGNAGRDGPQARTIDGIQDPSERALVRDGYEKAKRNIEGLSEAVYLAVYDDPKADVLELQRLERQKRRA